MDKRFILDEIRRTATANGGKALGWRGFANETGIKESDWLGKYWARWSDAVREAGLEPQAMIAAYSNSDLLARYALLARELGRLPTANDLRLKDRVTEGFPNAKVYERLGSKSELVRLLLAYCHEQGEFEDVCTMCEEYSPARRTPTQPLTAGDSVLGDVYLIKSGRFYKIGKSNASGRRMYELAIQLPERATTVHVIRTDDPAGIEAYWHRRFSDKRKNGEWFDLMASDVAAFKLRKFM